MAKKKICIIGGGISGTALGYNLSLYDDAGVTLYEKGRIGAGTTSKSAGTVCLFDDSLNNRYWDVRLYGFETYCKMEQEKRDRLDLTRRARWSVHWMKKTKNASRQVLHWQNPQVTRVNTSRIKTESRRFFR